MMDDSGAQLPIPIKLCLVGNSAVGKTSLGYRFSTKEGIDAVHRVTIGIEFKKKDMSIRVNDNEPATRKVRVAVWDTAGQEKYHSFARNGLRGANGAILVFSVSDRDSYDAIASTWLPMMEQECPKASLLLIGNKSDITGPERAISRDEAKAFAERNGCFYYETSAATGDNVELAFDTFVTAICRTQNLFARELKPIDTKVVQLGTTKQVAIVRSANESTTLVVQQPQPDKSLCEC